jgi:hypothetical protein
VLRDNAVGQSEANAMSTGFGREEGYENAL